MIRASIRVQPRTTGVPLLLREKNSCPISVNEEGFTPTVRKSTIEAACLEIVRQAVCRWPRELEGSLPEKMKQTNTAKGRRFFVYSVHQVVALRRHKSSVSTGAGIIQVRQPWSPESCQESQSGEGSSLPESQESQDVIVE